MSRDVLSALRALGLQAALGRESLAALAAHCEVSAVEDGGELEAPLGDGALGVVTGALELVRRDDGRAIAAFGEGRILSGCAAFEEEVRLRAAPSAETLRVDASGFDALLAADVAALEGLTTRLAPDERAVQLVIHLSRQFPGLDRLGLEEFAASAEWVSLRGGTVLFSAGDPGDAAYFVISGRLRASLGEGAEERVLNEVSAGETVGEMALIQADVRSATVYAVRDSQLARISRDAFYALTEHHPEVLRRIAGFVVDRLRRHSGGASKAATGASLAVVPAHPGVALGGVVARLGEALGRFGTVAHIDRHAVETVLGRPGIADASDEEVAGMRLVRWLGERDAKSRYVLYEADPDWTPWTERALRQADHVLVVGAADDGPEIGANEARLAELWRKTRRPRRSLVLLHAAGQAPRGTSAWLDRRDVERHFHVREGHDEDVARMARLIAGRGVGLVLGGGGARGFAHLGVLRALEETGVPIDAVGGTSMGAIIAALPAIGHDAATAHEICLRSFTSLFDPTLPMVSLLTGRRISDRLASVLVRYEIEDLPIPFFCVSTNLSRAQEVVHQRGSLFQAVRSSISLPGILPPVSLDGDLHVDGGLMDNLPIETMAGQCGGPVIAVDVSPEEDLRFELDLARGFSGWRALWNRVNPLSNAAGVPTLSTVLMRSVLVASLAEARERDAALAASLYLKLPVDGFGLLEFDAFAAIAAKGYEASAEAVQAWNAAQASGA